jgi:hypothetical protein
MVLLVLGDAVSLPLDNIYMNEYGLQKKKYGFIIIPFFCIWYLPLVEQFLIIFINLAI